MDVKELEAQLRGDFSQLFAENKKIEQIFKRMRNGVASYEDAHLFAIEIGDILKGAFNNLDLTDADLEAVSNVIVANAMTQNYNLSSMVCAVVQENLNDLAEVGLNPLQPEINTSKIAGLQTKLAESESTAVQNEVATAMSTYTQSVVDDWVKLNADFQAKIGMQPIIVREYEGMHYDPHRKPHWQNCKYCQDRAGTFAYADVTNEVYKRHLDCKCIVTYYPNKKAKGRITALAKGEKDTQQVLWNTGTGKPRTRKSTPKREKYNKTTAENIIGAVWGNNLATQHF